MHFIAIVVFDQILLHLVLTCISGVNTEIRWLSHHAPPLNKQCGRLHHLFLFSPASSLNKINNARAESPQNGTTIILKPFFYVNHCSHHGHAGRQNSAELCSRRRRRGESGTTLLLHRVRIGETFAFIFGLNVPNDQMVWQIGSQHVLKTFRMY